MNQFGHFVEVMFVLIGCQEAGRVDVVGFNDFAEGYFVAQIRIVLTSATAIVELVDHSRSIRRRAIIRARIRVSPSYLPVCPKAIKGEALTGMVRQYSLSAASSVSKHGEIDKHVVRLHRDERHSALIPPIQTDRNKRTKLECARNDSLNSALVRCREQMLCAS